MDNDNNQEETLIRRHQQQQEQQRQRLQQQQRQHPQSQQQHLRVDSRLGHHQGHNQLLTSAFHPPPPFPQQYQSGSGIPLAPRQQPQQHPYGPSSMSSSSSSSVGPRSEQLISSSSRNSTFTAQQQQYLTGPRGGGVAQGPAEEMFGFGGGGGMSAEAREQEAEALAIHRQYQQRLLQEQQQRRTSPSTPATPRLPAAHPFQNQAPNITHWQQQRQLQQPQHVWHVQPSQHQTSLQQSQRGPVGMSSTPFLAPAHPTTTTGRQRSSPRLSSSTSGRHASPVSSSSSSLSSRPRGSPVSFGRVSPYPPPQLTHRSQDHQYHRQSGATIDVNALPNLNPDPALRRHDHSQQQQQQSQRDIPPPLLTISRLQAGRAPLTSPPSARPTPPPPPAYDVGGSGSGGDGNGDGSGYGSTCPHEPRPVETVLPAQAPISIYGPRNSGGGMGDDGSAGGDLEMDYILEEEEQGPPPIEVTLNVDIPKSSRPPTEGVPSTTVLNVNPSWHVVFVETIQQQRVRTSVRIQFCPSSSTARLVEHRSKVRRLQTVQVIGYASRRVELSRRIQGQALLNRGGLTIHLDPASITFNEASYGFTLSLTSFEIDQLSRTRNSRPDIPLPLARQQNSAYCRRNLKEMYYDIISKDVSITLRPSGEVFYAHSVVLESHAYFRALIEQQNQSSQSSMAAAGQDAEDEGTRMMAVETEAVVDEEGYAQPLRPQPQQRSSDRQGSSRYPHGGGGPFSIGGGGNGSGQASQDRSRAKIMIEVNDTSSVVFRAVLHFMYIGHVPVTGVFANQAPQPQPQQAAASSATATQDAGSVTMSATALAMTTATGVESGSGSTVMTGLEALTAAATLAATEAASGTTLSSISGPSSALGASTVDLPMGPPPSPLTPIVTSAVAPTLMPGTTTTTDNAIGNGNGNAPAAAAATAATTTTTTTTTTMVGEFPWRDVYEVATRYQLSGLMHLSKVALLSRLDVDRAVRELFEWVYHHKPLIPAYVSFLIERVDVTVLNGRRSILWPYHDLCPAYDEIMMDFMRLLSERKNASTLI
ncbi:hypothetical protein KI688_001107 [Linnemannia hyalina]|uniref:BTB domain-containing protein n=1 Tax=Linnemannia hyalina TaxID=64524 RepID=A0A9P8BYM0_9FUNG|nr:hypothetical protein KI688_001107 [Linnemannia hyalina]